MPPRSATARSSWNGVPLCRSAAAFRVSPARSPMRSSSASRCAMARLCSSTRAARCWSRARAFRSGCSLDCSARWWRSPRSLVMHRETKPLARLAAAVDAIDLSGEPAPLPRPRGNAPEVRALVAAFERLQARLFGLLRARMALIGGISHDVRTFATRLRLRVEAIADDGRAPPRHRRYRRYDPAARRCASVEPRRRR